MRHASLLAPAFALVALVFCGGCGNSSTAAPPGGQSRWEYTFLEVLADSSGDGWFHLLSPELKVDTSIDKMQEALKKLGSRRTLEPAPPVNTYERIRWLDKSNLEVLNELGDQGWEFVSTGNGYTILKRAKTS